MERYLRALDEYLSDRESQAPLDDYARALESQGRMGDTELVHVNKDEVRLLELIGSGTTNPATGLREFFRGDQQSRDVESDGPPGSGTGPSDTSSTTGGDVGDRDERGGGDNDGVRGRAYEEDGMTTIDITYDFEDKVADNLASGMDLNEALDAAGGGGSTNFSGRDPDDRDERDGRGGDGTETVFSDRSSFPAGFNASNYLKANPDVAAAVARGETTAERHYSQHGQYEGRSLAPAPAPAPSQPAGFDGAAYLRANPDVAAAGLDPLYHYQTYGQYEGRSLGKPTQVTKKPKKKKKTPPPPPPDTLYTYSEAVDFALSQGLDPIAAEKRAQEMIDTIPYSFQTSYAVDPSINLLEPQDIKRTPYGTTLATATEPARKEYFDENIRDPLNEDTKISEQDYLNLQRGRDIIEGAEIEQIGMPPTVSDDLDFGSFDDDTGDTGDTGFDRTPLGGTEIRFGDVDPSEFGETDVDPSEFEETFVSQDRVDVGVPVSTLPEGSYQIDPETNTVSLNEEGRSYIDALAKGYRNEENEFGIDRQEIESLMQQGAVVGAPMVQVPTSIAGQDGSIEGSQARAGEGEDESGLAGGMAGKGRLGDSAQQATVEETPGVINIELFDSKILDDGTVVLSGGMIQEGEEAQPGILAPAEGEEVSRADADAEGLGLLPDEGGIGILPGEGGLIGTDSGIIGQSGSEGINPFTEGGDDGEDDETVRVSGPGESEEGEGPGTGDGVGTGTPPPLDLIDGGGDDGFEIPELAPEDPYEFGDGTYDPFLDFEYRQPQITSPFDFARDFGSYTLSPEIEQRFQDLTERRMDAGFKPAALYEPEFLEQIGIMTPERQAEPGIASLIGSRFPQMTPVEDRYPFASTPEDYAQSLVNAMRYSG